VVICQCCHLASLKTRKSRKLRRMPSTPTLESWAPVRKDGGDRSSSTTEMITMAPSKMFSESAQYLFEKGDGGREDQGGEGWRRAVGE
jgi:hypothetical protein